MNLLTNEPNPTGLRHYYTEELLHARPEALVEAIQMLNAHPDEIARVLLRYGYTEPEHDWRLSGSRPPQSFDRRKLIAASRFCRRVLGSYQRLR